MGRRYNYREKTPRCSHYHIECKIKHANLARQSIAQGLIPYRNQLHTLTYDNGLEFSEFPDIAQTLSANIYFAHRSSSCERGLNENTNGLIRLYSPKSQPLKTSPRRNWTASWINLTIDPEKFLVSKCHMSHSSKRTLYQLSLFTLEFAPYTSQRDSNLSKYRNQFLSLLP
ncbi:MAG: IS30 family transposase [Nitrospina sp.]|nr:IS30 family transposase [Nitrospina sp.]